MKFKKLEQGTINEVETKIVKEWKKKDILKRSVETRKEGKK